MDHSYQPPMTTLVNINGKLLPREEAKISVFDRGLLFGDSIYEVTLAYGLVVFQLNEHLKRLWQSAAGLFISPQFSKEELTAEIHKTVDALNSSTNSSTDSSTDSSTTYLRIIITRGESMRMGLDPAYCGPCNFIIIAIPHIPHPQKFYSQGIKLTFAKVIRNHQNALDPGIKTGNYLNNFLAFMSTKDEDGDEGEEKAHEAILLTAEGLVAECSTSNIWIVKDNIIKTPSPSIGLLEGITRATLLRIADNAGIAALENNFDKEELLAADECFITSATRKIFPVKQIENKLIGKGVPGGVTVKLLDLYHKFIEDYIKNNRGRERYGRT